MTPERHQQIKRLFLAAIELAPGDVNAFLTSACREDCELRAEVESMLAHHRTQTLLQGGSRTENLRLVNSAIAAAGDGGGESEGAANGKGRVEGTVIGRRYRLEYLLGRGGMGSVYRAHDIELDQTIAVKFLSAKLAGDAAAIELLRREVQTARQITHPNVVRVFDIGSADGETFVTMEFVAGEDLASLVQRAGPLPPTKVLQIAQQLAAGLAAAHQAGILHRDLKPANVMINAAGNVRILDFGIAAALDDSRALRRLSGTPGFVAPEVLHGELPTERSDLYGWALVVNYAATGELPTNVSSQYCSPDGDDRLRAAGLRDELATTIRSCLSHDPAQRFASAHELFAALTAEDPLGEVLRTGHTPSSALLGTTSSWKPTSRSLDVLLAIGGLLLIAITLLADQTLFLSRCGLVKSPDVLREIAQRVLGKVGFDSPSGPQRIGVTIDTDCLQFIRAHPEITDAWQRIASGEIPAVYFTYQEGDLRLPSPLPLHLDQLKRFSPARTTVHIDGRGKLLFLQVADNSAARARIGQEMDFARLFSLAGLNLSDFQDAPPTPAPPVFADQVHKWNGPISFAPSQRLQVTGAEFQGLPIYFKVEYPWQVESASDPPRNQSSKFVAIHTAIWLFASLVAAVLAWRNVTLGDVPWQTAWRVTAGVLSLGALDWLCGSHHSFDFAQETAAAFDWLLVIVFAGAVAGITYLAVEPLARRWWPWSIITLRRLLDGRVRDRTIWADVLLGLVFGFVSVVLRQTLSLSNRVVGISVSGLNDFDPSQNLLDHLGFRYRVAVIISALLFAVLQSLFLLTLIVVSKRILRSTALATIVVVVLLAGVSIVGRGVVSPIDWLTRMLLLSIAAAVLLRFGFLAAFVSLASYYSINNAPVTLVWSAWYAPTGLIVIGTAATALILSWRFARKSTTDMNRSLWA